MIRSTSNNHVRTIRSLRDDRSLRRSERMFVLEGVRLVADLLASGNAPVFVLYDPDQLATTSAGQALMDALAFSAGAVYAASAEVIKAASDTTSPQGVVAVARWPTWPVVTAPRLVVVCDHIQDPGNLGTIIRSSDAVGVDALYCSVGSVDAYAPKTVRASMGSLMRVPIFQDMAWDALARTLAPYRIYAADGGGQSVAYTQIDWRTPSVLIVGNEAHGLSTAARQLAQQTIHIPMRAGIESLNAAMAASIILFEAQRQQMKN